MQLCDVEWYPLRQTRNLIMCMTDRPLATVQQHTHILHWAIAQNNINDKFIQWYWNAYLHCLTSRPTQTRYMPSVHRDRFLRYILEIVRVVQFFPKKPHVQSHMQNRWEWKIINFIRKIPFFMRFIVKIFTWSICIKNLQRLVEMVVKKQKFVGSFCRNRLICSIKCVKSVVKCWCLKKVIVDDIYVTPKP